MKKKSIVVVGSGIAGLFSALLAKSRQPDAHVTLIESSNQLGGLLASFNIDGHWFDYGTHVPRYTGHDEIDDLLFSVIDDRSWRKFSNINAANVGPFNCLYTRSSNPYLASEDNTQRQQQLSELLARKNTPQNYTSLERQLNANYGPQLTQQFFEPIMKKRFGVSTAELAPNSHLAISLGRLILGDDEQMRELKSVPAYDQKLAFGSQLEGMSSLANFYPRDGEGVHLWVNSLIDKLQQWGVTVMTETQVEKIDVSENEVSSLSLSHGDALSCDLLIWTAPLFLLIKAAGLNYLPEYKPLFRSTSLYHFVFDTSPLISSNYVNVYDAGFDTFRVTLYTNLSQSTSSSHRVTVEVMHDTADSAPAAEAIQQELIAMGIFGEEAKASITHVATAASGFPVLTPAFQSELERQKRIVLSQLQNVLTTGKASGTAFFMADVVKEAYDELLAMIDNQASVTTKAS